MASARALAGGVLDVNYEDKCFGGRQWRRRRPDELGSGTWWHSGEEVRPGGRLEPLGLQCYDGDLALDRWRFDDGG
jgi:hypothetical protein